MSNCSGVIHGLDTDQVSGAVIDKVQVSLNFVTRSEGPLSILGLRFNPDNSHTSDTVRGAATVGPHLGSALGQFVSSAPTSATDVLSLFLNFLSAPRGFGGMLRHVFPISPMFTAQMQGIYSRIDIAMPSAAGS